MHPELLRIPFTELTIKSYGLMLVFGFLGAIYVFRRLSRDMGGKGDLIINGALYALISGVLGARLLFVIYNWHQFKGNLASIFAIWQGGLIQLGGVVSAMSVILGYLYYHKLPIRRYLDMLAIALFVALAFGRIGCFLNGCCFGKPTEMPWGVRFPFGSHAYVSQVYPDPERNRPEPHLRLPDTYFINFEGQKVLKDYESLTAEQKKEVSHGQCGALPVHPTQLYSSVLAFCGAIVVYFFWKRSRAAEKEEKKKKLIKPGCSFALMLILYGVGRFFIEYIRDDNPFEFDGLTVSQNISIGLILIGVVLMVVFERLKSAPFLAERKEVKK